MQTVVLSEISGAPHLSLQFFIFKLTEVRCVQGHFEYLMTLTCWGGGGTFLMNILYSDALLCTLVPYLSTNKSQYESIYFHCELENGCMPTR